MDKFIRSMGIFIHFFLSYGVIGGVVSYCK